MKISPGHLVKGKYKVIKLIGYGQGDCSVYVGEEIDGGIRVRLKVIPRGTVDGGDLIETIYQKQQEAFQVCPSSIPAPLGWGQEEDFYFIASKFIEGETLQDVLERYAIIQPKDAMKLGIALCDVLRGLHHEGLFHTDLKPSNIIFTTAKQSLSFDEISEGEIILLDFAMSQLWQATGGNYPQPFFLAPEQLGHGAKVDERSDIYSLGAILYAAVVGRPPFEEVSVDGLVSKILQASPQQPRLINSEIPEEVNSLIMCAIEKEPDARFQSVEEFRAIIKNILEFMASVEAEGGGFEDDTTSVFTKLDLEGKTPLEKVAEEFGIVDDSVEGWERAAGVLEEILKDDSYNIEEKKSAGRKLAIIYENKMFDSVLAKEVYLNLHQLFPGDSEILDELERISTITSDFELLARVVMERAEVEQNVEKKIEGYLRCAEIFSQQLGEYQRGIAFYEKILSELQPENRDALDGLRKAYISLGRWNEYFEIANKLIPLSSDELKVELYEEMASVCLENLSDPEGAKSAYENILKIQPDNPVVEALVRDLQQRIGEEADGGSQHLQPPSTAGAPEAEERVETKPQIESASSRMRQEAPLAPEQGKPPLPPPVPSGKETATVVSVDIDEIPHEDTKIEVRLEDGQSPEEVIQQRLDAFEVEEDKDKRCMLLLETARIYQTMMGDDESAFILAQKGFLENPSESRAVALVEELASKLGRWDEVISVVNERIAEIGPRRDSADLYAQVGIWYIEKMGQPQYGIAALGKALQVDPDNIKAIVALSDQYRFAGQWDTYFHILKIQGEKAKSPDTKKEIFFRLGRQLWQQQSRPDEAIKHLEEVISIDPLDSRAISCLEEIYRKTAKGRELVSLLKRKVDLVEDDDKKKEIFLEIASVFESTVGELVSSADFYKKAIEIDEGCIDALKGLKRVYAALNQRRDLLDVLEMLVERTSVDKEKVEYLLEMGSIYEKEMIKPELAEEKYRRVLEFDPDNLPALESLEKIYRASKAWDGLVEVLIKFSALSPSPERKADYLVAAGKIAAENLRDLNRSTELLEQAVDIADGNIEALEMLAGLYLEQGNYGASCDIMDRCAELVSDNERKCKLLYKASVVYRERLGDNQKAIDRLNELISIFPDNLEALGALRTIYVEMQNWPAAIRALELEEQATTDPKQKSNLLYARGRILEDYLNKPQEALELYVKAVEIWPENEEAARPVADHYLRSGKFQEVIPLLRIIIDRSQELADSERSVYCQRLAEVYFACGREGEALDAYKHSYEYDKGNVETIKAMAHLLFKMERWKEAYRFFHQIITKHADTQDKDEKIDVFYHLGIIRLKTGEWRRALKLFESILEINPHHRPTLEVCSEFFTDRLDWEQVVRFKRMIAEVVEGDERFNLLVEIGDIWLERLSNAIKAIALYNEALKLKPDNRTVMHKLVRLYTDTKQWIKTVEVLERIAQLEEDPSRRARYYHSIGIIYQSEIKKVDAAVECFNKALDTDPEHLKSFEAIEKLLTPLKEWGKLEQNYKRMIERVKGRGNKILEENLYHNLGEIYRTRMKRFEEAAHVFTLALQLNPSNTTRREILAQLYTLLPERWEDALKHHYELLKADPMRVESLKEIRRIYHDNQMFDESWCVSNALVVLGKADEEEVAFVDYYRPQEWHPPQGQIDYDSWISLLYHPDESVFIGKIFEIVTPILFNRKVQPHKAYNLRRKDKLDPLATPHPVVKMFVITSKALAVSLPELFVAKGTSAPLLYAITSPPASVIGAGFAEASVTVAQLAYLIAKHLSYYRAEHYVTLLEPTVAGLSTIVLSSIKVVNPSFQVPPEAEKQVEAVGRVISQGLTPLLYEKLGGVVRAMLRTGADTNVAKWLQAVEFTAMRAGFLLSGDLAESIKVATAEGATVAGVSSKEKMKQFISFATSPQYFKLRKILGQNINITV